MKNSEINNPVAIKLAKSHNPEEWATHVAVRDDLSKAESCMFGVESGEFVDEDISLLNKGEWCGAYKETYWTFFPLSDL